MSGDGGRVDSYGRWQEIEPEEPRWQPDRRTVDAVVEALRQAGPFTPLALVHSPGIAAANWVEERFKASGPGGGHGG